MVSRGIWTILLWNFANWPAEFGMENFLRKTVGPSINGNYELLCHIFEESDSSCIIIAVMRYY